MEVYQYLNEKLPIDAWNESKLINFDEARKYYKSKICLLTFAYHNEDIIKGLMKRGDHIKNEEWDKVNQINKELIEKVDKCVKDKGMCSAQPCKVFITFDDEESKLRANAYNQHYNYSYETHEVFLGEYIDIEEAGEPSDIIWENCNISKKQRLGRGLLVFLAIFLLLCSSFILIFTSEKTMARLTDMYPQQKCEQIE